MGAHEPGGIGIGIGFLDDAAVLGQTIKSVHAELDAFREWEMAQAGES